MHHREECLQRELHHRPECDYRRQLQAQEPDDEGLHHVGQRRNRIFPPREPDHRQLLGNVCETNAQGGANAPPCVLLQKMQN